LEWNEKDEQRSKKRDEKEVPLEAEP